MAVIGNAGGHFQTGSASIYGGRWGTSLKHGTRACGICGVHGLGRREDGRYDVSSWKGGCGRWGSDTAIGYYRI